MSAVRCAEHDRVSDFDGVSPLTTSVPAPWRTSISDFGDPDLDDVELLSACHLGDAAAFTQLYQRHAPQVRRVCLANVGNPETAEDLVQETFARLFEALADLEGDRISHWLVRVAKRLCIDERRRRRNTELPLKAVEPAAAADGFEGAVLVRHAVDGVLRQLRQPDAALLSQHHIHDLSLRAMAQHWGSTEKSLSVRLSRARRAFAAKGAHLRTLGMAPVLWLRSRVAGRGGSVQVHGGVAATVGVQLAVVAMLGLPAAGVAVADDTPHPPSPAVVTMETDTARVPRDDRARPEQRPELGRRDRHAHGRSRTPAPAGAAVQRRPVFTPVEVPGTSLRIHQEGLRNKERYRYEVDADPLPASTTLAREDEQHAAHDTACPAVAQAPAVVTCTQTP